MPAVATEKTDRITVIVNDDEYKVDVYKTNLSSKIIRGIDYRAKTYVALWARFL